MLMNLAHNDILSLFCILWFPLSLLMIFSLDSKLKKAEQNHIDFLLKILPFFMLMKDSDKKKPVDESFKEFEELIKHMKEDTHNANT